MVKFHRLQHSEHLTLSNRCPGGHLPRHDGALHLRGDSNVVVRGHALSLAVTCQSGRLGRAGQTGRASHLAGSALEGSNRLLPHHQLGGNGSK